MGTRNTVEYAQFLNAYRIDCIYGIHSLMKWQGIWRHKIT